MKRARVVRVAQDYTFNVSWNHLNRSRQWEPFDEDFPPGSREVIAEALPVYRTYDNYDLAKRLMDAATIIGRLRAAGFKLAKR